MTDYAVPPADLAFTAPPPSTTANQGLIVNISTIDFSDAFNYFDLATPMFLTSLERGLFWAPGVLNLTLDLADVGATAYFRIGGTLVATGVVGADGTCGPISLQVPAINAGWHTATATVGAKSVSYDFAVDRNPRAPIIPPVPDANPVIVASEAGFVQRWVLQDLMPGGLGSWVMPANPRSMTPMPRLFTVETSHTTSVDAGQYHLSEAAPAPLPWSFAGYSPDQDFYDHLVAYGALNRRFYLIDHRNRAWTVTFDSVEMTPRHRQKLQDGSYNDWAADYTVRALVYDQTPKVPA